MAEAKKTNNDWSTTFRSDVMWADHKRVHPCFMTGKGCVYAEIINRDLEARRVTHHCSPVRERLRKKQYHDNAALETLKAINALEYDKRPAGDSSTQPE